MTSRVRLFNTYEPVTVLYRSLIPLLAHEGIPVSVYLSRAEYRPGRNLDATLAPLSSVRVHRLTSLGLHARHGTAAKAMIGVLYFLGTLIRTLLAGGRYRNLFLTQPPFIPFLGLVLSKVRNQRYCVVLMDLQPQLAAAVGILEKHSLAYRLFRRLNCAALRKADRVVVIGRCMADAVRALGVKDESIRVIPNWVDCDKIRPVSHSDNRFRREMGWGGCFVVMFAGNLGYPQPMEDLIAAAERLQEHRRIRFVIIGEGVRKAALEARLASIGLANFELHAFMHQHFDLSEILSAADLHFVSLHPAVTGFAVPSKTYSILAVGRPFVFQGSEDSEVARIAREEGVGIVVPPQNPSKISAAILELAEDPDRTGRLGRRGRMLTKERWNSMNAASAHLAVLAELEKIEPVCEHQSERKS
ncbi:MAG: glycosyltransferase family 4 protein [Acidobacteriota bacterium]